MNSPFYVDDQGLNLTVAFNRYTLFFNRHPFIAISQDKMVVYKRAFEDQAHQKIPSSIS